MKNFVIILLLFATIPSITAQLSLGVSTSYATPLVKTDNILLGDDFGRKAYNIGITEVNSPASLGIGLLATGKKTFFNVEAHYRLNTYTFRVIDFSGTDDLPVDMEQKVSTIHVPVSAGLLFGKLKVGGGPIFNIDADFSESLSDMNQFEDKSRSLNMGWQWLVGYNITKNVSLNAKYEYSFSRVGDRHYYRGKRLGIDSRLNYLTVGMSFYL